MLRSSDNYMLTYIFLYPAAPQIPSVQLKNAAKPGVVMPAIGLGTFGYATIPTKGDCGTYPECWDEVSGVSARCFQAFFH